jgi:DNA-binding transcriptional LysR family regulator
MRVNQSIARQLTTDKPVSTTIGIVAIMKTPNVRSRFIKPSLDPQKLAHFLSVYETGNFSTAATLNNVSQQAVSKSIARLEAGLGVQLFERGIYGAEPTIFAHTLARRAKVIMAESRLAAAELSALRGSDKGYVRIGLGWSLLPRIGPMMINRFKERQPEVTLSITSGDTKSLHEQLLRGEVEFVASAPPAEMEIDDALEIQQLFEDRDVIMMRRDHPLAKQNQISLEDLSRQTWLVSLKLTEQWRHICSVFLARGVAPPANYVDLDSVVLIKSLLQQSDSIALLAKELVSQGGDDSLYYFHEGTDFPIARTAFLATRRNSPLQPLAQGLRNDLIASCRAIIEPSLLRG